MLAMADGKDEPRFKVALKPDREFYETQLYFANEALADNDLDGRCSA